MSKATWTRPAREDLRAIGRYIGREKRRPRIAAKNVREIKAKCDEFSEAFCQGSVLGSDASEIGDSCRIFPYKRWVIIFEPIPGGIEVLRVLDGSRDYPRLFQ